MSCLSLAQLYHLPSRKAAARLGIAQNMLKRVCRVMGIKRWPQRKLACLTALMEALDNELDKAAQKVGQRGGEEQVRQNTLLPPTRPVPPHPPTRTAVPGGRQPFF